MQMNMTLAAKVEGCTLARCLDAHRFDTYPLVLNGACSAFADHFLRIARDCGVPVLMNSSAEFPCCVRIATGQFNAEQLSKLRKSMEKLVARSAVAETERQVFPFAFSQAKIEVEKKQAARSEDDKNEVKSIYGQGDWVCPFRDVLGSWMNVNKNLTVTETMLLEADVCLWMSSQNRLGLIAYLINFAPGLAAFLSNDAKKMELPLMVFELLSMVDPVVYRRINDSKDPRDVEISLAFKSRDYSSGGFYAGLPFRDSASHVFAKMCEKKQPITQEYAVFKPLGGMTALFELFAHTARMRHIDIALVDGFIHSCMGYTLSIVHTFNRDGAKVRPAVLPTLTGSEVKLGWRLVKQGLELADEDIQRVAPIALDSFSGKIPHIPNNVINATKRGFCRQFVNPDSSPSIARKWHDTRYALLTVAEAERCMCNHAHYDGILTLRKWATDFKKQTDDAKADHKETVRKLADETKTTLASIVQKKGPKSVSRIVCIELKNVNAANCVPSIEEVLIYGTEFFAVEYFSREDGHYNTLIITRSSDWQAYQVYCCISVFQKTNEILTQNRAEGTDIICMSQASTLFQLITSGCASQLRVAFWALGRWYGLEGTSPRTVDSGHLKRIATCLRRCPLEPGVVWALVAGDLLGVLLRERLELMRMLEEDSKDERIRLSLDHLLSVMPAPSESPKADPTRYDSISMQMHLAKPRTKAHLFNTVHEPGCNNDHDGVGSVLMTALVKAEKYHCGSESDTGFPREVELCGKASHVCTSLYDFPLAFNKSKGKVIYADSSVFIHRRDYDEELDKSEMYRWFEKVHNESLPLDLFAGGNAIRRLDLNPTVPKGSNKRPVAQFVQPMGKKQRVYEPEATYSPTSDSI
jgi:hypothetical protein